VDLIVGGLFKRYLRLLIPTIIICSIYKLAVFLDTKHRFNAVTHGDQNQYLFDMFFGIWYSNPTQFHYTFASWTLPFELYCSYFAFAFTLVVGQLSHRWFIYLCVFAFLCYPIHLYNLGI
jgi:peptidoglycan/LPS O-acetylase OafA/YrhL